MDYWEVRLLKKLTGKNWIDISNSEIRTGVDIVDNSRIRNILKDKRESFYKKILTEAELDYIISKNHSVESIAGIFAGKEAVSKVIGRGIGNISWTDIEISHNSFGKPYIKLSPNGYKFLRLEGLKSIEISISHEKEYTVAFAIGNLGCTSLEDGIE